MVMHMLNSRRRRFVEEYVKDWNATRAAIRAGYSKKTAKAQGARLLTFVDVSQAIAERANKIAAKAELTTDYIIDGLRENFRRAMQAEPASDEEGNPIGAYVYNGAVANRSLELLGKHLGMFVDRTLTTSVSLEELLAGSRGVAPAPSHNGNGHHANGTNGNGKRLPAGSV